MQTTNQQLIKGIETNLPILNDKITNGIQEFKNYLEGLKYEKYEQRKDETEDDAIKRAESIYDRLDEMIRRNQLSNKKALDTIELLKKMIDLFNEIVKKTDVEKEKLAVRNDELIDIIIDLERRKTDKLIDQYPRKKNTLRGGFEDKKEEWNEHRIKTKETPQKQVILPISKPSVINLDNDEMKQGSTKLYVGNLNYATTEANLKTHFESFGKVKEAKLTMLRGYSRGYGFIEYETEEDAKKAVAGANGVEFERRKLRVEIVRPLRDRTQDEGENKTTGPREKEEKGVVEELSDNLVFIRNIACTVKDEDLKEMFKPFNVVSAKVVTRTFRGNLRSKGFVEVKSAEDQKAAVENLNGTTQNGRVVLVSKALKKHEKEYKQDNKD